MGERFNKGRARLLLDLLAPERRTRVADIGANPLGATPYQGLLAMGACDVWGFEPQPEAYEKLVESKGERENYVPHAVGDGTPGKLNICTQSGFTSMLEPNPDFVKFTGHFRHGLQVAETISVQTARLDDLELPEIDLVKIDIQGSEAAVFENGTGVLGAALAVITEVSALPLYKDQPLLDDQMRVLRASGYFLHKFLFFNRLKLRRPQTRGLGPRHTNQLSDGDAVFLRDIMQFESFASERLKHLAIIADTIFDSLDISCAVLGELLRRGEIEEKPAAAYIAAVAKV